LICFKSGVATVTGKAGGAFCASAIVAPQTAVASKIEENTIADRESLRRKGSNTVMLDRVQDKMEWKSVSRAGAAPEYRPENYHSAS
jgi:hypothetical protein